jgi:hypothetical protein
MSRLLTSLTSGCDNRVTLSATLPQSLSAGAFDKEVFEDEAASATLEWSAATAALYRDPLSRVRPRLE